MQIEFSLECSARSAPPGNHYHASVPACREGNFYPNAQKYLRHFLIIWGIFRYSDIKFTAAAARFGGRVVRFRLRALGRRKG